MCTDVYVGYQDGAALADLPIMIRNVSSSLLGFFFQGGRMTFVVCECIVCVCMRTLLVESRSHPKIQSRNIHMSESFFFFFSCPTSRRSWWGPSLSGGKSAFAYMDIYMYTYMVLGMCSRSILYIPSTTHIHVGRPNKCAPSSREKFSSND